MDAEAKKLIVGNFPELEERIEVTGQPAFDRFAAEDTERIKSEVRKELNLTPEESLITFISAGAKMELVEKLAEELKKVKKRFKLAFGIHPRDNTPPQMYEKIFKDAGVAFINAEQVGIDRIGAASDTVLLIVSTEGLHAIYRRKPTLHITDPAFVKAQKGLDPPPPVKLGASVGLNDMNALSVTIEQLLDTESPESLRLQERMEENYPADGRNAERVVNVLRTELEKQ